MSKTYNGHPSYNAWNIALWFGGDEGLYRLALQCKRSARTIEDAAARMMERLPAKTPDGGAIHQNQRNPCFARSITQKEPAMTNPLSPAYLANFYGSETFVRWSPLTESILSEGAHHVANAAGAFWLFDAIDSHLTTAGCNDDTVFTVANLTVTDDKAELLLDDGNGNVWARQSIPYTDFPLPKFKTYAVWNGNGWTHMLPSEY